MDNNEKLERSKRLEKYLEYRDRVLEGDVLTRAQYDEYRSLEREFLRQARPRVVETEAHEEEMAGAPKMDNVASTSEISSLPKDDIPFKPVIKTNDDFVDVSRNILASTTTSTGDDKPFTPRVITDVDMNFHSSPKEGDMYRGVSPLKGVASLDPNKTMLLDDSMDDAILEIAHGGSTNAGQAHMLNLSQEDYADILTLNIDGVDYGAKVLRAIQERRVKGEDYMDIVEVAKEGDAEKLNKLLSDGHTR